MATNGAGFAGFAAWLDMTPADPDILAIPDQYTALCMITPYRQESKRLTQ